MKRAKKRVKGKKGEERTSSSWDQDSWRNERVEKIGGPLIVY